MLFAGIRSEKGGEGTEESLWGEEATEMGDSGGLGASLSASQAGTSQACRKGDRDTLQGNALPFVFTNRGT